MADVARNHHFIPEFLLGNFTPSGTKNDFLWVTDIQERKGYSTRPRNAGFQKDFYRVDVDDAPPDIIERILGWFEGCAAPAVRYVLENRTLPPRPELDHLMELVGLLAVRVPAARARVERMLDEVMKAMLRPYHTDPEMLRAVVERMRQEGVDVPEEIDYDEVARFAQDEDAYTLGVDKEWLLGQMAEASMHAQRMLFGRNWSVLVAEGGAGQFICSDAPVCLTWTDSDRQDRIPRLYEHQTNLTVALGRAVALRGRYEPGQPEVVRCNRQAVAHVNTRTISSADRFLYSSGKDFPWERDDGSVGDWDALMADLAAAATKRQD